MAMEALIYSTSLEFVFIVLSISGTALSVLILYLSNWQKRIIPFILHLVTTTVFLAGRVAMIQSVVHLSTSGAIRNTEYWDWNHILSTLTNIKSVQYTATILLFGIILLPTALIIEKNK